MLCQLYITAALHRSPQCTPRVIITKGMVVPINKKLYTCTPPSHKVYPHLIIDSAEICNYNNDLIAVGCWKSPENTAKDGFCVQHFRVLI